MTRSNAANNNTRFHFVALSHVNVTVPTDAEAAAKNFYGTVLGLRELPKPAGTRQNLGAWYELGDVQLHLSVEENANNAASDRHVCYLVADVAKAQRYLLDSGVEIISDPRPIAGVNRFYVRDPGGNRLEIAQAV